MEKKQKTLEGNPSRSSKNLIVTIAIFVLIVALIVVGLLILRKHKKPREDTTEMPYYSSVSGELATAEDGSPITVRQNPTMRVAGTAPIAGTTAPAGQTAAATTRAAGSASTTAANGANRGAASTTRAGGGGSNSGNGGGTANNTPAPAPAATTKASGGRSNVDSAAELRDINAFINGVFTMEGTLVGDDGGGQRIRLTKDHNNIKAGMDLEGMALTFLLTNGKMYLVNDTDRKFTEFDEAMASMLGVDPSEFTDMFGGSLDLFDPTETRFDNGVRSESTYSGQKAVVYDFPQDSGVTLRFTLVNGGLKRLTVIDSAAGDSDDYGIVFNSFSGNLPANAFSLAGYEKQSLMDFMSAMNIEGMEGF